MRPIFSESTARWTVYTNRLDNDAAHLAVYIAEASGEKNTNTFFQKMTKHAHVLLQKEKNDSFYFWMKKKYQFFIANDATVDILLSYRRHKTLLLMAKSTKKK